jgi:putative RNA 2'-phosphotransferase
MTTDPDHDSPSTPVPLDEEKAERLSRFLALVLRHRAPSFHLDVDPEGFVRIDDLLDLIAERQRSLDWVDAVHIESLVGTEGRRRFEIRGDAVRATYGHSFERPIRYETAVPPDRLYIASARTKVPEVRGRGLLPVGRQYVHLSADPDEAMEIGRHHDASPSLVTVLAREAHAGGVSFHHPAQGIYLAASIPPAFIDVEVAYGRSPRKSRRGARP